MSVKQETASRSDFDSSRSSRDRKRASSRSRSPRSRRSRSRSRSPPRSHDSPPTTSSSSSHRSSNDPSSSSSSSSRKRRFDDAGSSDHNTTVVKKEEPTDDHGGDANSDESKSKRPSRFGGRADDRDRASPPPSHRGAGDRDRDRDRERDRDRNRDQDRNRDRRGPPGGTSGGGDFRVKRPPAQSGMEAARLSPPREYGRKDRDRSPPAPRPLPELKLEKTGKLLETENRLGTVSIKYTEPADARLPDRRWRLYPFKDGEQLDTLHLHRQTFFLFGKDFKACHVYLAHPSVSKQHAVLQFRRREIVDDDGESRAEITPYLIDLESTNGTLLNGKKIEPARYYQLKPQDMLKFGFSTRSFVLLVEDLVEDPDDEAETEQGNGSEAKGTANDEDEFV